MVCHVEESLIGVVSLTEGWINWLKLKINKHQTAIDFLRLVLKRAIFQANLNADLEPEQKQFYSFLSTMLPSR